MVGKIVGTAAFLSIIVLIWLQLVRADFSLPACLGAGFLFLIIGAYGTIDLSDWQRKPKDKQS